MEIAFVKIARVFRIEIDILQCIHTNVHYKN